jgi:hypothetical protein
LIEARNTRELTRLQQRLLHLPGRSHPGNREL